MLSLITLLHDVASSGYWTLLVEIAAWKVRWCQAQAQVQVLGFGC